MSNKMKASTTDLLHKGCQKNLTGMAGKNDEVSGEMLKE